MSDRLEALNHKLRQVNGWILPLSDGSVSMLLRLHSLSAPGDLPLPSELHINS
jgi:hypothetical protein